ncbi:hypothetical protein HKD37_02G004852 [Glycine soja]
MDSQKASISGYDGSDNVEHHRVSQASNAPVADEVEHHIQDLTSKQSTTSNEATSRDKGKHDVVIIYSTSFGPTPLNFAQPATFAHDQVQDMIGQAMETFAECQRQENKQPQFVVTPTHVPQPPPIPASLDPSPTTLASIPPLPSSAPPPVQH